MPMEILILLKSYFICNLAEVIIFTDDIIKNGFESATKWKDRYTAPLWPCWGNEPLLVKDRT